MCRLLQKLGIDARVRTVDPAQYQHLTDDFDFDMIMMIYPESDMPGNELRDYFSCAASKAQGSFNTPGICDPAVDALVERIVMAQDRETLTTAARALDRVLLWRWYMVPNWDSRTSTSPIGTASAIRTSRSARGSTSTPGGWTRRNPRRSTRRSGSDAAGPSPHLPQGRGIS